MSEKESASGRAGRIMREVDLAAKSSYSKGEVKGILNMIAQTPDAPVMSADAMGCRAPAIVTDLRRGDVFIAKMVGGKVRPWIVLSVDDGVVRALAMSSGDTTPCAVPTQCRLWPNSWIGGTLSLFPLDTAGAEVMRPYTNLAHLAEVEAAALSAYTPSSASIISLSDVRARLAARIGKHSDAISSPAIPENMTPEKVLSK